MQKLLFAVAGLVAGFYLAKSKYEKEQLPAAQPKTNASPPPSQPATYNFKCWLCHGNTVFKCVPPHEERHYNMDCCRCGVPNKVRVCPQPVNA